jgi:hypothetical protein
MKISDYRREYAKFCAAREREKLRSYLNPVHEARDDSAHEIFADLFSLETIENLRRELKDAPAQFETEQAGRRALLATAQLIRVEIESKEADGEIKRCEDKANFTWKDTVVSAKSGARIIAQETAPALRREILVRWLGSERSCDDLRMARVESLHATTRTLGFNDYSALRLDASLTDARALDSLASDFLELTAPVYHRRLREWAVSDVSSSTIEQLTYADALFFKRANRMDARFRQNDLRAIYEATLSDLGIRFDQQPNVRIEKAGKGEGNTHSAYFAVRPPDEIYLFAAADKRANEFPNFLDCAGRVQHHAWTSAELVARNPEFVYAPDSAANRAYGFLFRSLFQDEQWLREHFNFAAKTIIDTARYFALLELHDARLCAARARAFIAATANASETKVEDWVRLVTEATGFRYEIGIYWLDEKMHAESIDELRARFFAAHLGEHLRTQHGRKWWASRGSRDELIDLWNTGSRYSVEELARHLTGAREFEVGLLEHSSTEALREI